MVEFIFDCPYCHLPHSEVIGQAVDIHSGATYKCAECGEFVVFQVFTTDEYVAYCEWDRQQRLEEAH